MDSTILLPGPSRLATGMRESVWCVRCGKFAEILSVHRDLREDSFVIVAHCHDEEEEAVRVASSAVEAADDIAALLSDVEPVAVFVDPEA